MVFSSVMMYICTKQNHRIVFQYLCCRWHGDWRQIWECKAGLFARLVKTATQTPGAKHYPLLNTKCLAWSYKLLNTTILICSRMLCIVTKTNHEFVLGFFFNTKKNFICCTITNLLRIEVFTFAAFYKIVNEPTDWWTCVSVKLVVQHGLSAQLG